MIFLSKFVRIDGCVWAEMENAVNKDPLKAYDIGK